MKRRSVSSIVFTVFGVIVLAGCAGLPMISPAANPSLGLPAPTQVETALGAVASGISGDSLAAYQGTLENIYAVVSPSVVNIRVVEKTDISSLDTLQIPGFPFFSLPGSQPPARQVQSALGSGFVWDESGHIVTNNHVVAGADKIEVTFSDGKSVPATLVGTDPDSDLAVLKVAVGSEELQPVQLADSNAVQVGQLAIAIGNPFGLEGTMTTGIISAVGRSLPADEAVAQSYTIPDVIQTDAAINPGNSGGVLVDMQGQVMGVTSAIESPVHVNAGIGFAIPSAIVKNVVPVLIRDGRYVHSWLGISGTSLTLDLAGAMTLDADQRGALVEEVFPNSPAEKVGLRGSSQEVTIDGQIVKVGGDVITAADGQALAGMDDLIAYLSRSTRVGQKVVLTILRDGRQETLEVILTARPSPQARTDSQPAVRGIRLGIIGTTVDNEIAREMALPLSQQGVLVEEVQPGSLADFTGLRGGSRSVTLHGQTLPIGGDIITAVNGQPVATLQDLKVMLAQLPPAEDFVLTILRDGTQLKLTLQPGL